MNESLFRPEVLAASQRNWLGTISLVQPLRLRWLSGLAMIAAALVTVFVCVGQYTQRSRVSGELVPDLGLAIVVAPTDGVVTRVLAREGEVLPNGAPVGVIEIPRSVASGADLLPQLRRVLGQRQASLVSQSNSRSSLLDTQEVGYQKQLAALRRELEQIGMEVSTRREQVRIARENVERFRAVVADGYVSELQFRQQQQAVLELHAQQQVLERQATSLRKSISNIEQSLAELPSERQEESAALMHELAQLDQERLQQEATGQLMVKVPIAGVVSHRVVEPGQSVRAGAPLVSLVPQGAKLEAHLLVPSRNIGFVELGDSVLLRYSAYPYQKFGHFRGNVIGISRSTLPFGRGAAEAQSRGESHYRVIVALERQSVTAYGRQEGLWPGMAVEADILGERRRLYEWIFEPLYAASGKLGG